VRGDQPGVAEQPEVVAGRRLRRRQRGAQVRDLAVPAGHQPQQPQPLGVTEHAEQVAQRV
jgi:hypothetical protein